MKESGRKFEVEFEPRFVTQLPRVTVARCYKQNQWIQKVNSTRKSSDLSSRLLFGALLHGSSFCATSLGGERNDSDAILQGRSCSPGTHTLPFLDQKAVWFCWDNAELSDSFFLLVAAETT